MKTIPFWSDDFPQPDDLPVVDELPPQVDVAIVGSGYTGLNAARVLARSGASVAVLERETIGWGASSRNGGMATPGLKQKAAVIMKRYGRDLGHVFWRASLDAIDLLEAIIAEEQIDCDWRRNGYTALAYKPSHFETMQQNAAWFERELGHTVTVTPPAALRSEIGSNLFHGGLADDFGAGLHPARYVFGLARAVARRGGQLCPGAGVSRIARQSVGFDVHTARGVIRAREVVIATNGYTDRLIPQLKPKLFPVGSYCIVTEPLPPDLQQTLSPRGRMFYDSKWFLNYFRLTPDGRMLWGGRNNLSTNLDLNQSAAILRTQMVRAFPDLHDAAITHSWTGKLGITFDLMPNLGRVDGVHFAFGYGGHGLSIATYLGAEVGKLLSGAISRTPFAEIPHQTMFFYRNKPWFIPLAAWYYRFLDWKS